MKLLKILLSALLLTGIVAPASAVTDKEMEQARAITAQAYLRYANDGSGYLDEFRATSMQELEGKLKSQEKENLKAFKSVKVPTDYASWDKAKLVEFWSATFFSSPALTDKGKIAKGRVRSRLQAMTVADPKKDAASEKKEEAPKPEEKPVAQETQPAETPATTEASPSASAAIEEQEAILAEQQQIETDIDAEEQAETLRTRRSGNTWIYIAALLVLVIVVVVLVVFAAKTMKHQSERIASQDDDDDERRADDSRQIETLKQKAIETEALTTQQSGHIMELEKENVRLKQRISELNAEISTLRQQAAKAPALQQPVQHPHRGTTPTPRETTGPRTQAEMPKEIYLGRVNPRGIFVRADRKLSPGNTIYRLDTSDGIVGTFRIVDNPTVHEMILMDPNTLLAAGCSVVNPEDVEVARSVVTDKAGTAIFEDGYWKVLRKTVARYI